MGGYTTYNEKRIWDELQENAPCRASAGQKLSVSDFKNLTIQEKQEFLRRYCRRPGNYSESRRRRRSKSPGSRKTWKVVREKSSTWNDGESQSSGQEETLTSLPRGSTATVLENLRHLMERGEDYKDLRLIVLEENSKRHERLTVREDKGVQADWTMILETREVHARQQELHSSTPNLSEENKRSAARHVRKSVSDSEDDEERHKVLSRIQKVVDASRQREDNLIAHLRDYRGRMDELHRKIALRDSNIQRLEAEICRLREVLVECRGKEREMQSLISDLQLNIMDQEAQYDEDLTLCQLREAELKHTIDELRVVNKHLREENSRLNIEQLQRLNSKRTKVRDGKHSSLEGVITDDNVTIHNRQSRSFDTLSSATSNPQHDHHHHDLPHLQQQHHHHQNQHLQPSPPSYQTSKPIDQKVFLNGRIIMSHSTNLQQVLGMHGDFLNFSKTKHDPQEHLASTETRGRSRTPRESEKTAERCNSEQQSNEKNLSVPFQKNPPKLDSQGNSPNLKRHASPKLGHQQGNDVRQPPSPQQQQQQHQQQQHSKPSKYANQQSKLSQNQNKHETRTQNC